MAGDAPEQIGNSALTSVIDEGRRPALSFSFGRNWRSYARFVSQSAIDEAARDIADWLGEDGVSGKTIVDVGCGSGIHSLGFHRLAAANLVSLDVDPDSVACTRQFWEKSGRPSNWRVMQSSVLDEQAMAGLGQFDIVYSWGVLHHTGQMWQAIDNASRLAKADGGRLWIALYAKGDNYPGDLESKLSFNRKSWMAKQAFVLRYLVRRWRNERRQGRRLKDWFWHGRGMNAYHDAIDWFGGLPYEVASVEEVIAFLAERGWKLDRVDEVGEGGCSTFLLHR
jgi:SAM-dependent methyltransferase